MSVLPQVIIGGAQKCGTTSLHRLLKSHPEIYVPAWPQEIHYFDVPDNFRRGLSWYARHFRGWKGQRIIAQTSPLYMYESSVAGRIHNLLPDAKLIFILRDPVDRAYSHYWHEVRYGTERLSFEDALRCESQRLEGGFQQRRSFSYVDRGRYATQLRRFEELFPRERILLLRLDDLQSDPAVVCGQLADFLEVDAGGFALRPARKWHYNQSRLPRFAWVQRQVASIRRRWKALGYVVDMINLRAVRYPPMAEPTRSWLKNLFSKELEELATRWPLDLSLWRMDRMAEGKLS